MTKIIGKLIGFVVFACLFACIAGGVVFASTERGRTVLENATGMSLPEPPQIDTSGLPPLPLPDVKIPEQLQPGEAILTRDQVKRQPLFARVPAPQQLSLEGEVIGTNVFLAILMALLFGITTTVLGNMMRDEEVRIQAWLQAFGIKRLTEWLGKAFQWTLGGAIKKGCLTMPLVLAIFALYGIIYAFLEADPGTPIFSGDGALLIITLAFTVGIVAFAADFARRIMGRVWHTKSQYNLYPVNLAVAILTVIASRIFVLTPGIIVGTPGGADVDLPEDKREQREVALSFVTLVLWAVVGGIAWAVSGYIQTVVGSVFPERIVNAVATGLTVAEGLSLAVFLVALETLFFEMLPVAYGTGQTIFKWNKFAWAVLFVPVAFLFNHALLNPESGFLDSFFHSNVRFAWFMLLALVGVTGGLWFYFNVVDDVLRDWLGIKLPGDEPPPPPPPPSYYPPQPPQY